MDNVNDFDVIQTLPEEESASQIDFSKLLRGIWKRKFFILLLSAITTIPFYMKAKNQVPIYRAQVTIKTQQTDSDADKILSNERQAEMRSRTFAERVASQMGLAFVFYDSLSKYHDGFFVEYHTTTNPIAGYYRIEISDLGDYSLYQMVDSKETLIDSAYVWDVAEGLKTINGFSFRLNPQYIHSATSFKFRIRPFSKAVGEIRNDVQVNVSRSGAFMILEMQGTDPDLLPEKLNRIAQVYVQETVKLKSRDVNSYRDNLERRLRAAEMNLRKSEEDLRNFYARYPLSLEAEKQELLSRLRANDQALQDLPRQIQQLSELLERLDQPHEALDPKQFRRVIIRQIANFPAMAQEPSMAILRVTLEQQETAYDQLYQATSDDNLQVQELERKIQDTQEKIISFASKFRNTLAAKQSEQREKLRNIQAQVQMLPADESRLMELERSKNINENLYTTLLTELQKLQLAETVEGQSISILDPAIRPNSAINPSKKITVILGSLLGLGLGVLISVVLDLLDKSIRTFADVERRLKLPVLGAIPAVTFKDIADYQDSEKANQIDRQLVTHDYSPTPIGESYRALRTQLMFSKKAGKIQTMILTSISPEEGKSFTASNLAIILAQQRTNTLLVDADLRRGVLHNTFSMHKEPGLTAYLSNNSTLSNIVQQSHIPNLAIISCGAMVPNPSELLGSLQMRRFFGEVRRKFDFILFDVPPLDSATDAVVLSTQVDAVAVVVRAGKTKYTLAKEKLEIFQKIPANLVGIIINGSETALVSNAYSYYHY